MNNNKTIVVTAFGLGKTIEKISVGLFDGSGYSGNSSASNYCKIINSLELKEDAWVYAKILDENIQYSLNIFGPIKFSETILKYGDRAIQKVLRETDSQELALALRAATEPAREVIFRNMSKRAVTMLKEDMEVMGPRSKKDCEAAQEEILRIFLHLEDTGEIVEKGDCI